MIKCLNCKKEFEPKKKSAKYCSDRCRVYYNRGKEKPDATTKINYNNKIMEIAAQVQHIVNKLDKIELAKESLPIDNKPIINEHKSPVLETTKPIAAVAFAGRRFKSVNQYVKERLEIETPDDFEIWEEYLESDPYLNDNDKHQARTRTY